MLESVPQWVNDKRKYIEQYYTLEDIWYYAKDGYKLDMSEQQCKDFLTEHEEEIALRMREVADEMIDGLLYDLEQEIIDEKERND